MKKIFYSLIFIFITNNLWVDNKGDINNKNQQEEIVLKLQKLCETGNASLCYSPRKMYENGIQGPVPSKYHSNSILIYIGSVNTKVEYIEKDPLRTPVEMPYGILSLTEEAKIESPKMSYKENLNKIAPKDISKKIRSVLSKKASPLYRDYVFMGEEKNCLGKDNTPVS